MGSGEITKTSSAQTTNMMQLQNVGNEREACVISKVSYLELVDWVVFPRWRTELKISFPDSSSFVPVSLQLSRERNTQTRRCKQRMREISDHKRLDI